MIVQTLTEDEYRSLCADAARWAAFREANVTGPDMLFELLEQSTAYRSPEMTADDFDEAMDVAMIKLRNAKTAS